MSERFAARVPSADRFSFNTLLRPEFSALRAAPERPSRAVHRDMASTRATPEGLPLLNPTKSPTSRTRGGGAIISAAGYTFSAFFWIAALSLGVLLGYFVTTQYAASPATAVPTIPRAATGEVNGTSTLASVPAAYTSRPLGPRDETVCPAKPLVSNAGQNLPACQTVRRIFDELLEQVLLPFWLGPDGLGVDCESGGFANLGLQPGTIGAGEAWKLRERWLAPHARTAYAFARLHRAGRHARAKDAAGSLPWRADRNGNAHPTCLRDGTPLSVATHAMAFVRDALRDDALGGYFTAVAEGGVEGMTLFAPTRDDKHLEGIAAVLMAAAEISMAAEAGSDEAKEAAETADDAFATMQRRHRDALPGGGFWPEVTERDWSLPDTKHPPRTLSAHLAALEALTTYVDSLVARGAEPGVVAAVANALADDVETLAKKTLGDDVEVGSNGGRRDDEIATLGTLFGTLEALGLGDESGDENGKGERSASDPVAREFYDREWNPSPASLHVRGPDDVDPVTGVGAFDVRFGRVLELTWTLLEASRAVERAAFATRGAGGSVADVRPPTLSASKLRAANDYAWTFGLRDGGVVAGVGGLWSGVRDFDGKNVDDYTHQEHDRERGEWWAELEATTSALHDWELTGSREARNRFVKELGVVWGYFVDWKSEPQAGTLARKFASAGMRSVITDEQREAKAEQPESLDTKRSVRKDPFRAVRAVLELQDVLERGVDRARVDG